MDIETIKYLVFWFDYMYLFFIAFTFLLFNLNIIQLYKENKLIDNPLLHGLFSFGFPIVWYKCYKNWKKEKEEDS